MKALLSTGSNKFHMVPLAAELAGRGLLEMMITAGYPSSAFNSLIESSGLKRFAPISRMIDRREPGLPECLVSADWASELILQFSSKMRGRASQLASAFALRNYTRRSAGIVAHSSAEILHYRSGYGGSAVHVAKKNGMTTLCDHSIAGPMTLDYLISRRGRVPTAEEIRSDPPRLDPFWDLVQKDIDASDYIIVNSDFVKETLVVSGVSSDRILVSQLGVDEKFFSYLEAGRNRKITNVPQARRRLCFAGGFCERKGSSVLEKALLRLARARSDWSIDLACAPDDQSRESLKRLQNLGNVALHGMLPREKLAALLLESDIFVFPTFAEGSARVVFEALAAGCFVITTRNSGTVAVDGMNGSLIPPGDEDALFNALNSSLDLPPSAIKDIGSSNSSMVSRDFRQKDYGTRVIGIYDAILKSSATHPGNPPNPIRH